MTAAPRTAAPGNGDVGNGDPAPGRPATDVGTLRVLWVYHSGVVDEWRRGRVDALRAHGVEVTTVTARSWNEGGSLVHLSPGDDEAVVGVRTFGTHPFLFSYDPVPIRRLLTTEHFDVLDFHEEPASLALAELLGAVDSARLTTPVVCYSAQNIPKTYPVPFRWMEQRALRRVSAVHGCNDDVATVLGAKGFTGEVVNLGLGIDTELFCPDGPSNSPDDSSRIGSGGDQPVDGRLHVGYVGRIEERKGIFTLLGAIESLEDTTATFVGAGPGEGQLRAAIAARRLDARVHIRGYVDHHELPGLYRSFDVIVTPSIDTPSWREQFGRVVVEAMACGVPVVVTAAGALAEVVADAGVVVAQRDGRALAEALASLWDSSELRADLSERGRVRAEHFSWDNIAARQAAMYDRVARRAPVPPVAS